MKNRVGEVGWNKRGEKMVIVEYVKYHNIVVEFKDGCKTTTSYYHFIQGTTQHPNAPVLYKIGYTGEGQYKVQVNGKKTIQYDIWKLMLRRCYDAKSHLNYIDCTVCEEWHNFQNFAKWYDENYYEVGDEKMELDKDILVKGNKVYSPKTCIFAPRRINSLFTISKRSKNGLPLGAIRNGKGYIVRIKHKEKNTATNYGTYSTPEEAFCVYKRVKEEYIKKVAEEYRDRIPERLYEAMYKWKIEIRD